MSKYQKKQSNINAPFLVGIAVILVVVIAIGYLSDWFRNWDVKSWFVTDKSEESKGDGFVVGGMENYGIQLSSALVSDTDKNTYVLTATVTPSYATNAKIDWTLSWASAGEGVTIGTTKDKPVTDYITMTVSADTKTATIKRIDYFDTTVVVKATSNADNTKLATCNFDSYRLIKGIAKNSNNILNYYQDANEVMTYWGVSTEFTLGTKNDSFSSEYSRLDFTNEFKTAMIAEAENLGYTDVIDWTNTTYCDISLFQQSTQGRFGINESVLIEMFGLTSVDDQMKGAIEHVFTNLVNSPSFNEVAVNSPFKYSSKVQGINSGYVFEVSDYQIWVSSITISPSNVELGNSQYIF